MEVFIQTNVCVTLIVFDVLCFVAGWALLPPAVCFTYCRGTKLADLVHKCVQVGRTRIKDIRLFHQPSISH